MVVLEEPREGETDISKAGSCSQRRGRFCSPEPRPHKRTGAVAKAKGQGCSSVFVMMVDRLPLCGRQLNHWGERAPSHCWKMPPEAEVGSGEWRKEAQRGGERGKSVKDMVPFFFFPSSLLLPLGKSPNSYHRVAGNCGLQEKGEWGSAWKPKGSM